MNIEKLTQTNTELCVDLAMFDITRSTPNKQRDQWNEEILMKNVYQRVLYIRSYHIRSHYHIQIFT